MSFTNIQNDKCSSLKLDIKSSALECLLDYIYTRECKLTLNNVNEIIDAAKFCRMTNLFHYCCDYLTNNVNDDNIFHLYNFAKIQSNLKLRSVTHEYLM